MAEPYTSEQEEWLRSNMAQPPAWIFTAWREQFPDQQQRTLEGLGMKMRSLRGGSGRVKKRRRRAPYQTFTNTKAGFDSHTVLGAVMNDRNAIQNDAQMQDFDDDVECDGDDERNDSDTDSEDNNSRSYIPRGSSHPPIALKSRKQGDVSTAIAWQGLLPSLVDTLAACEAMPHLQRCNAQSSPGKQCNRLAQFKCEQCLILYFCIACEHSHNMWNPLHNILLWNGFQFQHVDGIRHPLQLQAWEIKHKINEHNICGDAILGREDELVLLRKALLPIGARVFIHGGEGVGKTALARAHLQLQGTESNPSVVQAAILRASSEAELQDELARFGRATLPRGLLSEQDSNAITAVEETLRWLGSHDQWHLALDNVKDFHVLQDLLQRLNGRGHLLFLSRDPLSVEDAGSFTGVQMELCALREQVAQQLLARELFRFQRVLEESVFKELFQNAVDSSQLPQNVMYLADQLVQNWDQRINCVVNYLAACGLGHVAPPREQLPPLGHAESLEWHSRGGAMRDFTLTGSAGQVKIVVQIPAGENVISHLCKVHVLQRYTHMHMQTHVGTPYNRVCECYCI